MAVRCSPTHGIYIIPAIQIALEREITYEFAVFMSIITGDYSLNSNRFHHALSNALNDRNK